MSKASQGLAPACRTGRSLPPTIMTQEEVRRLYEQYGNWVFNRAKGLLKNEESAWEAVQEVFLKVLQSGSGFRGESSPWTWLYRITTNHCLNLIRSQKTWNRVAGDLTREQLARQIEGGGSNQEVLINQASFVQLIAGEDETTQKILLAYYRDEMTQEEITVMLNLSRKTVYKRLKKFLEKSRRCL